MRTDVNEDVEEETFQTQRSWVMDSLFRRELTCCRSYDCWLCRTTKLCVASGKTPPLPPRVPVCETGISRTDTGLCCEDGVRKYSGKLLGQ